MKENRINEIDLLRTCAIILMVIFHIVYDLNEFMGFQINYLEFPWWYIGKMSAILFIFVSGISTNFSRKNIKRGLKVYLLGMGITAVTYVIFPDTYIRFGILHFLGISIMMACFLKKTNKTTLFIMSIFSIIIGYNINKIDVNTFWFIPFGVTYNEFSSIDYYPLFPYIGYFILGVLLGKVFYKERKSFISLGRFKGVIRYISNNSLLIYIAHQPVILLFMFGLSGDYLF